MVIRCIEHGSKDYEKMIDLRLEVLLNPIGVPVSFIDQQAERHDVLIGAFEQDKMVGCCVLSSRGNEKVQLRQMAVHTKLQGSGVGSAILKFAEKAAKEKGFGTLYLHARDKAVPFYLKARYAIIGEAFEEVGIEHRVMVKELYCYMAFYILVMAVT
jgi:predicted GNAT family N-acyltransferase